ncbi:hypothetical protein HPB51_024329 [Rhipicephalus microplus]|uniref:Uncharacterized protein n=1 Tax=Rhipicephalus microplus TaxID=6941 RepID=A0A9J6DXQ7_RHIMP|nr:hypothetical protein HPB51_024329 [Rhipicephalus microplus]
MKRTTTANKKRKKTREEKHLDYDKETLVSLSENYQLTPVLLVYFSEALNDLAARHWQAFSSQQYFDSQGMFISLVFSTPLLLNCIIMVGGLRKQAFGV